MDDNVNTKQNRIHVIFQNFIPLAGRHDPVLFLFFFDKTNKLAGSCLYEKPFFIGKLISTFHYVDGSSNMD